MTETDAPSLAVEAEQEAEIDPGAPTLNVDVLDQIAAKTEGPAPMETPPSEQQALDHGAGRGVSAWHSSKKITAMWCNSGTRNAFAAVQGLGWRRISNANDSAFVSLVALLSHAEQVNANCKLRIEADGKIHEAYVF